MDTVTIYDTQQSSPVCMLTKLHYDEFTDMTWCVIYILRPHVTVLISSCLHRSPDGQCLMLSSRDGYCTIVIFDEILPTHHTQQHALQLQSIAHHHSVPLTYSTSNSTSAPSAAVTPTATPSTSNTCLPHIVTPSSVSKKRPVRPLTPATSVDDNLSSSLLSQGSSSAGEGLEAKEDESDGNASLQAPPKKKRRVVLTRVGDLD
jgi:chromatin assembly factor 1 subunit B